MNFEDVYKNPLTAEISDDLAQQLEDIHNLAEDVIKLSETLKEDDLFNPNHVLVQDRLEKIILYSTRLDVFMLGIINCIILHASKKTLKRYLIQANGKAVKGSTKYNKSLAELSKFSKGECTNPFPDWYMELTKAYKTWQVGQTRPIVEGQPV